MTAVEQEPAPRREPASGDGSPPDMASSRARPAWRALPWLLVIGALGLAALSTWQWLALKSEADARAEVAVAATNFLTELVNWDASDGLDDTVGALRDRGTGRFLEQAEDLFGAGRGDELEAANASSQGEVEDLFVQELEDGRAEVFAVVSQRVSSAVSDGPRSTVHQAILQLERVDGEWRVENLELPLLVPQLPGPVDEES